MPRGIPKRSFEPGTKAAEITAAIAELQARLMVERSKITARKALAAYIAKRPSLTRADVLEVAHAMPTQRARREGAAPVVSKAAAPHSRYGAALRAAREDKGLSRVKLAAKLGVDGSALAHWEVGRYLPSADKRAKLAKLLDVEPPQTASRQGRRPGNGVPEPETRPLGQID